MSAAASAARKQDMPPPGGYKKIPFLRVPAKSYFTGEFQVTYVTHFNCYSINSF